MESSSLSIIVPIAVGLIIFLIEKASEKKNTTTAPKGPRAPRRPVVTVDPQAEEAARRAEAARYAALSRRRNAARAAEEVIAAIKRELPAPEPVVQEEGARVTVDRPMKAPERVRVAIPPVPGGDLRKAIIWSEILKRKF